MFMLSRLRDIFVRNRQRLVLTTVTFGGSYLIYRYFRRRVLANQSKQMRDFMEKTRRVQHFESTERTCNQMIIAINAEMLELINEKINVEELIVQLRSNPDNKLELWEEVKVLSVTRLTIIIYATSIVMVMLRIQLNLLGGYLYRDVSENGNRSKKVNEQVKQRYLSILHHYMHYGGLDALIERASEDIRNILKDVPLNRLLTISDIDHMFWTIEMSINNNVGYNPCLKMCEFVLSVKEQFETNSESFKLLECLLYETMDMIETDDTFSLCVVNANRSFSLALSALAEEIGAVPSEVRPYTAEDRYSSKIHPLDAIKSGDALRKDSKRSQSAVDLVAGKSSNSSTIGDSLDITNLSEVEENANAVSKDYNRPKQIALAKLIPFINSLTANGYDDTLLPETFVTKLVNSHINSEKGKVLGANVYETFSTLPIV